MQTSAKRQKLIKLIHIAKNQLHLSEDDYRAILESVTQKSSCAKMTAAELEAVLSAMKGLGFRVKKLSVKDEEIARATKNQLEYIKGMWELVARVKTDRALYSFIKRITGAEHPRFMSQKGGQNVITALREMMIRAGYDPDGFPLPRFDKSEN